MATNWNALVEDVALSKEAKKRKISYIEKKTWAVAKEYEEQLGFYYVSTYKDGKQILMRKDKRFDRQFEDKVWTIFFKLGFTIMNGADDFIIQWGPGAKDTQQIDVFAVDDETAIVVECKAAETLKEGTTTFKKNIEALIGQKNGIPNALLPEGLEVMKSWGFTYKTNLIWEKVRKDGEPDGRGVGFYFRNVTEILLFGVKTRKKADTFRTLQPGRSQVNILRTRKREHSRKPDEFIPLIESCSPGPYIELFARGIRDGWSMWGDQADSDYQPTWNTYANHTGS